VNKKGVTLLELMVVIAILVILVFGIIPLVKDAYGLELRTPILATDGNIKEITRAVSGDPDQTVVIIIYSAIWVADREGYVKIDKLMAEYERIMEKMVGYGISAKRITLLFSNQGGLDFDGIPVPETDGIYLYME